MPNPVVHFEIVGQDGPALQQFYRDLFGWSVDAGNPMNYGIVDNHGEGINGGISAPEPGGANRVTVYIAVDDLQAYLDRAEQLGGKTLMPPSDIPGMVRLATFQDPAGNLMGLVDAAGPPPAEG